MAHKKWVVRDADKEIASALSEKFNIDPFVAFLLVSRGIDNELDASMFLSKSVLITSPYDLIDMEEAVYTIQDSIDAGEKICVYGDYDCDGVTSTALLVHFLRSVGADVCYYIPNRKNDGYGLNTSAIDEIADMGVNLIITVDNGITAFDEAERIYELGMKLVVTDHHQLSDGRLPRAEAVVNPHRPENDITFRDYCGVGVAVKLAMALYDGDPEEIMQRYCDLVAIGTIADVMPLKDENRNFVRLGIDKINNNPRTSMAVFIARNGEKQYSSTDIAFQICPRINAMGRVGDASRAVEFLLCEDAQECECYCNELYSENDERQSIEKQILDDVTNALEQNPKLASDRVIVVAGENYHQGVIGIVASHIVEKYGKPAFIIGIDEDGVGRGSARSVSGFNLFEAISSCEDDLIQFGGHPLAAGVTLQADKIDDFRKHINAFALQNYPSMPVTELVMDCKLSPFYLSTDLVDSLSVLEPFGASNPQVVFAMFKLTLVSVTSLSDGKHIRLELEKKNKRFRVVKFSTRADDFPYQPGDVIDVAVKLSKNLYKNNMMLSVQAVDVRLSSTNDDKYFEEKTKYDMFRATGEGDKSLYPSREICVLIYKYLKANSGYPYSLDDLYFRLQERVSYGQLMFAIEAFLQAGLIRQEAGIKLLDTDKKVNLEETEILCSLKGSLGIE